MSLGAKRFCIIGGSGFLGSHVADELVRLGHKVRIFDCTPSPWISDKQEMIVGSILDSKLLRSAISDCYAVYNFASLSDLTTALNKPIETVKTNVLGNVEVLEACRIEGVKRFLYASTVYVYSREGGFYRCSKQAAEHYVEEYQKTYGLEYTILRYGSLYGPRSNSENGLFRIIKSAIDHGVIKYQGSSDSLREYIHVQDAAVASIAALDDQFINSSVVLTGQESMRVVDVLEMLREIMGLESEIEFTNQRQIGHYIRTPYAYQPKIGKKFIPPAHVDLGQGLMEMVSYIRGDKIAN